VGIAHRTSLARGRIDKPIPIKQLRRIIERIKSVSHIRFKKMVFRELTVFK